MVNLTKKVNREFSVDTWIIKWMPSANKKLDMGGYIQVRHDNKSRIKHHMF